MPFTPITQVKLLNVPLDETNENQLYFPNAASQAAYMEAHAVKSYTDFSFQRKDSTLRVPAHIDTLYNCNYVMYYNANYGSKLFYCFITEMRYINDGCTELVIKTDVFQTWFFDCTFHTSFVEREHSTTDEIGDNTQPEGLELGEYVTVHSSFDNNTSDLWVILCCTEKPTGESVNSRKRFCGLYNSLFYYAFDMDETDDLDALGQLLTDFDEAGKADAVTAVFVAPKVFFTVDNSHVVTGPGLTPNRYTISITDTQRLQNSYNPRNKKLLTYPFRYLLATNNAGSSAMFQYEYFTSAPQFDVAGVVCPGCSIKMVPKYYKGMTNNDDEGLMLGKLPILPWESDAYTNWLTQNSVNLAVGVVSSAAQIVGGIALAGTGAGALAGAGSIASGAAGIASTIGQVYQHSLTPDQARGNTNSGDIVAADRTCNFHFYHMSIREEYAKLIDSYFDMFGYKTNKVKVPNLSARPKWNYVKTLACNISGPVPSNDMKELKAIFDKGVTLWKHTATFGDYSQSNAIT